MISGICKANPMKLCTVIRLHKPCQNTKSKFQKSDLRCSIKLLLKTMGKFEPRETRQIIYHLKRNDENFLKFQFY